MPAAYAHDVVAIDAAKLLPEHSNEAFFSHEAIYLVGAQGPDIFFFHGILPPWKSHKINHTGVALHAQSGAKLARAVLELAKTDAQRAWALGYLCHWSTDSICHPFVNARSKAIPFMHGRIEMAADVELFRMKGNEGVPRHMAYVESIDKQDVESAASLLLNAIPHALQGVTAKLHEISNSVYDTLRVKKALYSPEGKGYKKLRTFENIIHNTGLITCHMLPVYTDVVDPLNLRGELWLGKKSSMTELLELSKVEAARKMRLAINYWHNEISLDDAIEPMGCLRLDNGE